MTDGELKDFGQTIKTALPGAVLEASVAYGELTLTVEPSRIIEAVRYLRDDPACLFICFTDLTAVDYPTRAPRFDVVTHLLSPKHNRRIRIKAGIDEDQPIESLTSLYPAADWYERETYDLFGIIFSDHPDLRRILTDYGFSGHPLRKDFPMTGYVEVRYNDEEKRVVYEPVHLNQAYRSFDFLSPWEGPVEYVLPGDEKASHDEDDKP